MSDDLAAKIASIHEFIQKHPPEVAAFLTTLKRDGQPFIRQVSTFVEDDWSIGTISRFTNLKMKHLRANPLATYLFVEGTGQTERYLNNVWIQGRIEIVEDPAQVQAFLERRAQVRNTPIPQVSYDRLLLKLHPTFLRAEGWMGRQTPIVLREADFNPG